MSNDPQKVSPERRTGSSSRSFFRWYGQRSVCVSCRLRCDSSPPNRRENFVNKGLRHRRVRRTVPAHVRDAARRGEGQALGTRYLNRHDP